MWSPVFPLSVPSAAPKNLTFELSDDQLVLSWAVLQEEELHGNLLAYKVQWTLGGEAQVRLGAYKQKLRLCMMQHPDVELQFDFLCCGCAFACRNLCCLRRTWLTCQEEDAFLIPPYKCLRVPS